MREPHQPDSKAGAGKSPVHSPAPDTRAPAAESAAPLAFDPGNADLQRTYGNLAVGRASLPEAGAASVQRAPAGRSPRAIAARLAHAGIVQRNPTPKDAWDRIVKHKEKAESLAAEAERDETGLTRVEEIKTEIDNVVKDVRSERDWLVGKKQVAQGYVSPANQAVSYVEARQERVVKEIDKKKAYAAVEAIQKLATGYKSGLRNAAQTWQRFATEAVTALRSAMAATTAADADGFAKTAESKQQHMAKVDKSFEEDKTKKRVAANKHLLAAQQHERAGERAAEAVRLLEAAIANVRTVLDLLLNDVNAAALAARQIAMAMTDLEKKQEAETKAGETTREKTEEAKQSEQKFKEAETRFKEAEEKAKEAEKLLDEATRAAEEAKEQAETARKGATESGERAKSLTRSVAFYEKHAGMAPGDLATKTVEKVKEDALKAQTEAEQKQKEAEEKEGIFKQKGEERDQKKSESEKARETAKQESESKEKAQKEQEKAQKGKEQAEAEEIKAREAKTEAEKKSTKAKQDPQDFIAMQQAFATGPGEAEEKLLARSLFGDADAAALLAANVNAKFLLDHSAAAMTLVAKWGAAKAGGVLDKMQALGGITTELSTALATALANELAVTAERATDLIGCKGGSLAWHIHHGLPTANKLLESEKWGKSDIADVLKAAETDAKLNATQLGKFYDLLHDVTLSVENSKKFLKTGVKAAFLVDNALSAIKTLLKAKTPWDPDKIVELVKAAEDPAKLTKAQFDTFCTLVDTHTVTADHAITIMKGCSCTGQYLVDTAFEALHKLVKDKAWTDAQVKAFAKPAQDTATLTKVQIERLAKLIADNNFTADSAKKCVETAGVPNWTTMMDRADDFIADGNKGPGGYGGGVAGTSVTFEHPPGSGNNITVQIQAARIGHYVEGHTYKYYLFTSTNINRGLASSMWARGTTATAVKNSAVGALANVHASAAAAIAGAGNKRTYFDQQENTGLLTGIEHFPGSGDTVLMQFYPTTAAAASIEPVTLEAIGRLFGQNV